MAKYPTITTRRGKISVKNSSLKAELVWNEGYPDNTRPFTEAQKFVDNEVLRLCEPFIPLKTGTLIKSGILGTVVGSGTVSWIAPYAAAQYYMVRVNPSQTGPLRGPYWFERMKQVFWKGIIAGARKIIRDGI
jgi:hypothetical protein